MRRRFLIPEVIQTSATDCAPASLKALFGGFGIYLSYGRLREACQTDIDGTSIDTLEAVAEGLGLDAVQLIMPADLLLLKESACLPAIVVVRLPGGATHFVVLWRVHGSLVQVMDPGAGRVWIQRRRFLASLYTHEQHVPIASWEKWSRTAAFCAGLEKRIHALGVGNRVWSDVAHLDASVRLAAALLDIGKLKRGVEAEQFLTLCEHNPEQIPAEYWTARKVEDDAEQVRMRGAVIVAAAGPKKEVTLEQLPESLAAARSEPPPRVWVPVWSAVKAAGWLLPSMLALALLTAAAGTAFEVLLFRGLFDITLHLKLNGQRVAGLTAVGIVVAGILALEWPATLGLLRLGRQVEMRLRASFLLKIPRLTDQYFQSRLISDMAFRAHTLHLLRQLPELAGQFVRLAASLLFTAAAIAWFYPGAVLHVTLAALAAVGIPLLFQPPLVERDLRFREISGALSRFYLDALLGVRAIQAHGAERTLRGAQAGQLRQWAEAGLRQQWMLVRAEAVQLTATLALVVALIYRQTAVAQSPTGLLLLIYWALSIPAIGRQLSSIAWSLPSLRNTLLRFLEPLGSRGEEPAETLPATNPRGIKLDIEGVTVIAAGHLLLDQISLTVAPGEHVGIVGPSGAGKSSLLGLLLGWHNPTHGCVRIDDALFDGSQLAQLRRETAWIDPQVHLFQTTLFDNLIYGNGGNAASQMNLVMEKTGLMDVLERLPDGLQTQLGEGGALVSGGEGQRLRMGRALLRCGIRLAILDEPSRGLDREERRNFLAAARRHFAGATLLCVTNDIADTLDFDRVLVIDEGRILEQGSPQELCKNSASRYRGLLDQEKAVHRDLWSNSMWRRLRMSAGVLNQEIGEDF
jgi:ABC-type bacteriocin/lantibiotic exporter with double-glycine peptidase domain